MKSFVAIFVVCSVLFSVGSCRKKTEVPPPVIEILSPLENDLVVLPATIHVKLHIASDRTLTMVRISIENAAQVPMTTPVFLYPAAGEFDFEVDVYIGKLPEGTSGPYYLRVKAENGGAARNDFVQLRFSGPELVSKGFYLVTRPGVSTTRVLFFDTAFGSSVFIDLPNAFNSAAVSQLDDQLYLSTKSPDRLRAFRFPTGETAWEKEAQMPFPEYFDLKLTDQLIYIGSGNGRIWGFRADNGKEQFVSPLVYDSVPGQIGIFEDFVVADYRSLVGPERGWLIFYKETAALVRKHSSQLSVQAFYPALSKNEALVLGNIGNLGVVQFYDIENNDILLSLNFATGIISASCPMETGSYLIAVGKDVWQFNETQKGLKLLRQTTDEVVDLKYDQASRQIYLATANRLNIFNATADTLIAEFESAATIQAVCLRLGYPDK
ncbi:MAG: hypothetical protein L3J66_12835 [Bacteroidales bacterium]|nr:hypothetical protein [Bacteroidales bacterium]